MKNVIVFAVGTQRYAIKLRWVREVVTLGHVTPVPTAPDTIAGAVNIRGAVTPVIELDRALALAGPPRPRESDSAIRKRRPARKGSGGLLVEANGVTAAIHMSTVETVTTLRLVEPSGSSSSGEGHRLSDGKGGEIDLVHVPKLLEATQQRVASARDMPGAFDGP